MAWKANIFGDQKTSLPSEGNTTSWRSFGAQGCAWGLGGLARHKVTICCHHLPSHLRHTIFTNDFRENRLSQALQALSRVQSESLSPTLCRSLQWRVVGQGRASSSGFESKSFQGVQHTQRVQQAHVSLLQLAYALHKLNI